MNRTTVLIGCGIGALVLALIGASSLVRAAAAIVLTCLAPGASAVRAIGIADRAHAVALAIGLSLAVTTVIATALMYAERWSWPACVVLLIAVTAGVHLLAPAREPR